MDVFNDNTKGIFTEKKTLIIVGFTDEWFDKKDLLFFNGVDTLIVYYLINEKIMKFTLMIKEFSFSVSIEKNN